MFCSIWYVCVPSVLWHCWLGHLTRKNPSPIWPIMCLVGRSALLNQSSFNLYHTAIHIYIIYIYHIYIFNLQPHVGHIYHIYIIYISIYITYKSSHLCLPPFPVRLFKSLWLGLWIFPKFNISRNFRKISGNISQAWTYNVYNCPSNSLIFLGATLKTNYVFLTRCIKLKHKDLASCLLILQRHFAMLHLETYHYN